MANQYTDAVHKIFDWDGTPENPFTAKEKTVLWTLAQHAEGSNPARAPLGSCFPGQTLLSSETYFSQSTVQRAVANLAGLKLLTTTPGYRGGFTYQLDIDAITAAAEAGAKNREEKKPKRRVRSGTIKGKDGKTYTHKPAEEPKEEIDFLDDSQLSDFYELPDGPCEFCGKVGCDCDVA